MAVFTRQISTQVTEGTKAELLALVVADAEIGRAREADAVRAALHLGLGPLAALTPRARVELYASLRSGIAEVDPAED